MHKRLTLRVISRGDGEFNYAGTVEDTSRENEDEGWSDVEILSKHGIGPGRELEDAVADLLGALKEGWDENVQDHDRRDPA